MRTAGRFVPVILLAALALADSGQSAFGSSFTVNSTVDTVDANPGDGVCADADGKCTLRAAVMETNALPGADEITVPDGTYKLTIPPLSGDASDASHGDIDITSDLAVVGIGVDRTLIDGGGLDRIFSVDPGSEAPGSVHAQISGLTLQDGHTDGDGGAILNRGTLTLTNIFIRQNSAERGGGVANLAGELTMVASTLSDNSGSNGGGGIYNEATITIDASAITGNEASFGGGLANAGSDALPSPFGSATVMNSTFTANSSGIGSGGGLTLTNVTIAYNSEFGLYVGPFAGVTLVNTIIAYNQQEHFGDGPHYTGSDCAGGPGFHSLGHNLDTDGTCGLSGPGDLSHDYAGLMAPSNDGGPTQTWPLFQLYCYDNSDVCQGTSHAIDAGDDTKCPATDQRGMPRPFDGNGDGVATCDIGAYERQDGPRHCEVGCGLMVGATPTPTPRALPPSGGPPPGGSPVSPAATLGLLGTTMSAVALALLLRRCGRDQT